MIGHLTEARDRIALGWKRTLNDWAGTESHRAQARETQTSLGLMAQAASAPEQTDIQRIFLSQSAVGMRDRVAVLLQIPKRTLAQERELRMIERELAVIEGRPPLSSRPPIRALFGAPVAATGLLGILGGLRFWHILAAGWAATMLGLGVQTARVNNLKETNRDLRGELAQTQRNLVEAQTQVQALANSVSQADAQTRTTAENIERERARRLRAEREARRIRDAMDQARTGGPIDYGFGGVRDAGEAEAPAADSDAAGGNPG